jgi:hypothetical protein
MPGLDASQLGTASAAGAGPPAGECDMARRVQAALRKDALAAGALNHVRLSPTAAGRTLLVWNGDWVQGSEEDGKGLAAVREAIVWEVGFAPPACRGQRVAGYVLLSLDDQPGALRVALGAASWRWSDLLGLDVRRAPAQ